MWLSGFILEFDAILKSGRDVNGVLAVAPSQSSLQSRSLVKKRKDQMLLQMWFKRLYAGFRCCAILIYDL